MLMLMQVLLMQVLLFGGPASSRDGVRVAVLTVTRWYSVSRNTMMPCVCSTTRHHPGQVLWQRGGACHLESV